MPDRWDAGAGQTHFYGGGCDAPVLHQLPPDTWRAVLRRTLGKAPPAGYGQVVYGNSYRAEQLPMRNVCAGKVGAKSITVIDLPSRLHFC